MAQGGPVLRPDPGQLTSVVPVDQTDTAPDETGVGEAGDHPPAETGEAAGGEAAAGSGDNESTEASGADEAERLFAESRQRRLRRLLRQCERINLMDFNILSLSGWPDNYTLNAARRRRDSWLLSATIAALVFLSGMTGFVPAWIAGGGFGAFVVILLMGVPFVRRLYSSKSSYLDLILYRQQLLRDARRHIAHLEGELGLIWQCNELSEFNPTLSSPRFSTLKHLSEQRRLAGSLSRREHIRLYLIFMLEAEKAYERMQNAYFEEHQKAIDRGWQSVARAVTEPEGRQEAIAEGEGEDAGKARKPGRDAGPDKAGSA